MTEYKQEVPLEKQEDNSSRKQKRQLDNFKNRYPLFEEPEEPYETRKLTPELEKILQSL